MKGCKLKSNIFRSRKAFLFISRISETSAHLSKYLIKFKNSVSPGSSL